MRNRTVWTFVITSIALFMVTLDNLVVTTALPVIRRDLGASLEGLEWTVNAYTLTFAVLLLTGAALGDRFGRRRDVRGRPRRLRRRLGRGRARADDRRARRRARLQGVGGAIVDAADADDPQRGGAAGEARHRARRLGRDQRPRGRARPRRRRRDRQRPLLAVDLLAERPDRPRPDPARAGAPRRDARADSALDLPGLGARRAPACSASSGAWSAATARAGRSPEIVGSLVVGALLVAGLRRVGAARAARRCCRCASSATARSRSRTLASLLMSFGMFGSIFLLAQFLQTVQGYSPLGAGVRILPWTAMPIFIAPIAGAFSDRIGGRPLIGVGLALQAISLGVDGARRRRRTCRTRELVGPFVIAGSGHGALLRADREHGALGGAAVGGGQGERRQQRDPRARRRLRRRRPRRGLRARRRLRERAGIRRRDDPGAVGRRRDRRRSARSPRSRSPASGARRSRPPSSSRRWPSDSAAPRLSPRAGAAAPRATIPAATRPSSANDARSPAEARRGRRRPAGRDEAEVAERRHRCHARARSCRAAARRAEERRRRDRDARAGDEERRRSDRRVRGERRGRRAGRRRPLPPRAARVSPTPRDE